MQTEIILPVYGWIMRSGRLEQPNFILTRQEILKSYLKRLLILKDLQSRRGTAHDTKWGVNCGKCQRTKAGEIYFGSMLEHILLQNLCAFYDVGEHNELKLHGADWNDALDMAWENGESVAFTCAYAGNMKDIAKCVRDLEKISGINRIEIAEEMECLFSSGEKLYENPEKNKNCWKVTQKNANIVYLEIQLL